MPPTCSSAQAVRAAPSARVCPAGRSSQPRRLARTWENLTAEYGVRLVRVQAPVGDVGQPVRRTAAHADEGIQGAGVTQDHPAAIDRQVTEQDHLPGRAGGPRDAEIDVEDGNGRLAVEGRRGRGDTHWQRSGRCPYCDRLAEPVAEMTAAAHRGRRGLLRRALTGLRPGVDPAGHAQHQDARRDGDAT